MTNSYIISILAFLMHPQATSWQIFEFSSKVSMLIFSKLQGLMSMLGSWLRTPMKGSAIGIIGGNPCSHSMTWTQCSPILKPSVTSQPAPESLCLEHSLDGSGLESTPKMVSPESSAKWFKSHYVPLEQLLNWMENQIQHIALKDNIGWPLKDT
jgi:hypothetical protein